jgi:hypothetical protein
MKRLVISRKTYNRIRFLYRVCGFLLCLSIMLAYAYIKDRVIEFCLLFITFFITKHSYRSQYHTESMLMCFLVSLSVFIGLISVTVSTTYSIMVSSVLGVITTFISNHISTTFVRVKHKPKSKLTITNFTRYALIEKCEELNISKYSTEFAEDSFIHNLTSAQLAQKYSISATSARMHKSRLKNKLFNK